MGYHRAGFEITGVDIAPQPNNPFPVIQSDAIAFLRKANPRDFDLVHASPPCLRHTAINYRTKHDAECLIEATREALVRFGRPYVIENVPRAPLHHPIMLCGTLFGLGVLRHRAFETSAFVLSPGECQHRGTVADGTYVSVHGGGRRSTHTISYEQQRHRWETAMGVTWAKTRTEIANAIPPAYTEFLGQNLSRVLGLK